MPKKGELPSVRMTDFGPQKRCSACRKWKSVSKFFMRGGRRIGWHARCKECYGGRRNKNGGYVPIYRVSWILDRIILRIGKVEASRRLGVPKSTVSAWCHTRRYVYRSTARDWILLLRQLEDDDERRTYREIKWNDELRASRRATRPAGVV